MLEYILKNIRNLREKHGFEQKTLADCLGINISSYSKLERGESKIKLNQLITLASFFGITLNELLGNLDNHNAKYVPNDIQIQAGFLGGQLSEFDEKSNLISFELPMFDEKGLFAIKVTGDSMYPTFPNGCFLIIKQADQKNIKWGEAFVLITDEVPLVKRILAHSNPDKLILRSDNMSNKIHEDQVISKTQIINLWIIKGMITKL